jgi:peptide deformylase
LSRAETQLLWHAGRPLPIVQWNRGAANPDSVLRRQAGSARTLSGRSLRRLDSLMRESLRQSGGVGLAAPQVSVSRRVILVQRQRPGRPVLTCVDPRIVRRSAAQVDGYEACLSIRGVGGLVKRAQWVEVAFYDLEGRAQRLRSEGWEARIFQHEVDHLEGRLYIDRLAGPLLPIEEMRRRRQLRRQGSGRKQSEHDAPARPWMAMTRAEDDPWLL